MAGGPGGVGGVGGAGGAGGAGGEGLTTTSHRQLLDKTTAVTSVGEKNRKHFLPKPTFFVTNQYISYKLVRAYILAKRCGSRLQEIAIF